MARYHINKDGNPGVCKAKPGNCPLGEDTPHAEFGSIDEAKAFAEIVNQAIHGKDAVSRFSKLDKLAEKYKVPKENIIIDGEHLLVNEAFYVTTYSRTGDFIDWQSTEDRGKALKGEIAANNWTEDETRAAYAKAYVIPKEQVIIPKATAYGQWKDVYVFLKNGYEIHGYDKDGVLKGATHAGAEGKNLSAEQWFADYAANEDFNKPRWR